MIGVFDSGLGGLVVLKEFIKKLPNYDYIYLGDNARAPYGNKSQEIIYEYSKQAVDFLFSKNCNLIVFACNSASAQALRKIQQEYLPIKYPEKKVLGVIKPMVEKIDSIGNISRVGIIGTRSTIKGDAYKKEFSKISSDLELFQQSAPLLVPLIEEGWLKKTETKMILRKYLRPLKQKQVQALVLACTHYPFLLNDIKRIMTKRCLVFNPGKIVADSLMDYLARHMELRIIENKNPKYNFFTTDETGHFKIMGERFLGRKIEKIEKIELS